MENDQVSLKTKLSIIAIIFVFFSGIMAETSMNVTFPILAHVFNTNLNIIQWVTTAYLLSLTATITTSAYLIKRYNIRTLWLIGVLLFAIGTLIGGLAINLWVLLLGRILQGIAAGIAMPLGLNVIMYTIPPSKVGTWIGIAGMIISLAPSLGPTYGGTILQLLGWHAIFLILLIAPVLSLLLGWKNVTNVKTPQTSQPFDKIGFVLLTAFLVFSLILINRFNWLAWGIVIVILGLFIWREHVSTQVFLNLKLFKDFSFVALFLPIGLYMFAMLGLNLIIPNFLEDVLHVSSSAAGFALFPGAILGALLNSWFGHMYDVSGVRKLLYLGNTIFALAALAMAILIHQLTLLMIIGLYIIFIIGRNMAYTSAQTAVVAERKPSEQADATAIIQTFQMFMGAAGTTMGALFQTRYGMLDGYRNFAYLAFGIAIFLVILFQIHFHAQKRTD